MAGVSAADLQGILPTGSSSKPSKLVAQAVRRAEKVSREVQALLGSSTPPISLQLARPQFKHKPKLSTSRSARWEWRSFANPGRSDSTLKLCHWVKADADPNEEYPFTKYNIQPTTYQYSQDEYGKYLEDKAWSKDETDYLFRLTEEFDTRWYVVYDRYDFPGGAPRSIEDLKDRYYSVIRRLVRNRPWPEDEESKKQFMSSIQYDKDREVTRKKYVQELGNKTPDQILEEEALYLELKKLEQTERTFRREREELLRTLLGVDSGLPDIQVDEEGPLAGSVSSDNKKRKRGATLLDDTTSIASPSNVISLNPPAPKRIPTAKSIAYDAQHCIQRLELPASTSSATKAAHQPATMRSYKLPVPKQAIAPKVYVALTELGITHGRLVMPTRENCAALETLFDATSSLLETKKAVDRVEQEIRIINDRFEADQNGDVKDDNEEADAEGEADGDGDNEEGGEETADGDAEGEQETTDGGTRAQSVVSTRSSRSRRHQKRSASVSSADTSATTRSGLKHQRATRSNHG